MNARKDRYAVRISEASYTEMQEQAAYDMLCCDRAGCI